MAARADDVDLARDRELVVRFQTGEVWAFEDLYARYYDRLRRMCMRRVGDAHEAEEIAQEAFARAYVAFPRLGGPRHVYAWLSVVASRLCVDTHRRRARTQPTDEVERSDVAVDDDRLETEVDLGHLRAALDRLTPRHREVLAFREQHAWSYQRIAEHYGVSLGTVEALLFRARQALRREFSAVANGRRELATLPVIGAIFRRLAALREKVDPWVPGVTSLPYAELTTIVALVTGVGLAGLAFGPAPGGATTRPDVAMSTGVPADASFAAAIAGAADDGVAAVNEARPAASQAADAPGNGGAGSSTAVPTPETMDFETTRQHAEESPTYASTDHVVVGLDPDELVEATAAATAAYAKQTHDWIERRLP